MTSENLKNVVISKGDRKYSSFTTPVFSHYQDNNSQLEDDLEVITFLKNHSLAITESGWAHCFVPQRDGFSTEDNVDIAKLNEAFYLETGELYHALDASRWHPVDNVSAKIDRIAPEDVKTTNKKAFGS